jgi:hypothetical protein
MTRLLQLMLTVLISIFLTSCACKKPETIVKKEYIYEKPYEFQTINRKGVYIELGDRATLMTCTPSLVELDSVYDGIIKYYEWQFNAYKEHKRFPDNNESK